MMNGVMMGMMMCGVILCILAKEVFSNIEVEKSLERSKVIS